MFASDLTESGMTDVIQTHSPEGRANASRRYSVPGSSWEESLTHVRQRDTSGSAKRYGYRNKQGEDEQCSGEERNGKTHRPHLRGKSQ